MFRLNPFVRVGLCLSAISCAWPVLAVDDDGETMVVTASSVEQNLKDAPASISVITQEDLQRKPVQNLKDVLKEVPGVQLTNEGDNRKGVSIRGLDSSYTLILVDGKRVNSRNAVFRHNDFDLNWIPVDSIERIESGSWPDVVAIRLRCARRCSEYHHQKNRSEMVGYRYRRYHHSGTSRSR
ncbi:catecholate siderophore receptor CirA [Escherichia coli]|uniref:Catecholate siderophore receptor CirA n=1 Tax=Escherichia coli TaxID=562 RepID=A0A376U7A9_ECOLX|nr:catecholate siderophore receptor CirA [Escherichia coli]